jgi:hypothetical protein
VTLLLLIIVAIALAVVLIAFLGARGNHARALDFLERVTWTLVQAASAEGILSVWEFARGSIDSHARAVILVGLTFLLSAVKNAAAGAFGQPTGSTLPSSQQPVPADRVLVEKGDSPTGAVAGPGTVGERYDVDPGQQVQQPTASDFGEPSTEPA